MQAPTISRIVVEGLFDQFTIDLSLSPGLNVIYGKNGRGKTTLLHILANILELDFARFSYLTFKRIQVWMHAGSSLTILKLPSDGGIRLLLDGGHLGSPVNSGAVELSEAERQLLRTVLGARPVYLPAFRSIMERVRTDVGYQVPSREAEFERIRQMELLAEKESGKPRQQFNPYRDSGALNARKTMQCREWFGEFVPMVRYPSIMEVSERLVQEYREAQLELAGHDRRMLSQMFVDVFSTLLSDEVVPTELEVETLIARVGESLAVDEALDEGDEDSLGASLAKVLEEVKGRGEHKEEAAERKVLKLYAQMLERRTAQRREVNARFRSFEAAVNRFLEGKTLRVKEDIRLSNRSSRVLFIESEDGLRKYPLNALSSGERQVLTMLFSASRLSVSPGMFLVDEPELSLHVDWQRMILSELQAQAGERQIVACTHAPEVGADHMTALQNFSPVRYSEPDLFTSDAVDSTLDELT